MIKKPTTLILGAGASMHLGYPLGSGLRDQILKTLPDIPARDPQSGRTDIPRVEGKLAKLITDNDDWRGFKENLSRGGWSSPDAFMEKHRDFISMGKRLIALALKQHERDDQLFPPMNNGWYGYLGSCLLGESIEEFRQNRLSIVTYNYDRSIECFLHNLIKCRYQLNDDDAWREVQQTIPIVHVHGILGAYPDVEYSIDGDILSIADGIRIVHEFEEVDGEFCSEEFRRANALLQQADVVYSLGFGLALSNVRRLKFFSPQVFADKRIMCVVGDMFPQEIMSLCGPIAEYGFNNLNVFNGGTSEFFRHRTTLA